MTISDEALEVAARVMLDKMYDDPTLKVDDEDRDIMRAALEAAAPHMQPLITTIEELEALPFGSVILDRSGLSLHKNEFTGWRASNGAKSVTVEMLENEALPATVLHVGAP